MEKLVTAMDKPQRRPLAWERTLFLLRSSLFTLHPLLRMPLLSLPISGRFCRTRAARLLLLWLSLLWVGWGTWALFDWWAIGCAVKWYGAY